MKNLNNINMNITQSYQPVLWSRCFRTVEAVLLLSGKEPSNKRKGGFC